MLSKHVLEAPGSGYKHFFLRENIKPVLAYTLKHFLRH
ncbi:MAG: hypothetical protein K0S28_449, partial [Paucimonas sp.]|nr:hypothetical protein [Paucimonas sp.]